MDNLVKADIFFFITTIAVVILTILISVVLGYLIIVLSNAKRISIQIRRQAELFEGDINEARDYIKKQGVTLATLVSLKNFFTKKSKKSK